MWKETNRVIYRPGVAGAVLQTALKLIKCSSWVVEIYLKQHNSQTVELESWNLKRMFTPHHVTCHMSHVTCHMLLFGKIFFKGETKIWKRKKWAKDIILKGLVHGGSEYYNGPKKHKQHSEGRTPHGRPYLLVTYDLTLEVGAVVIPEVCMALFTV